MLIGPPGVGKTAILEGLASRIVAKEVPESLQNKRVLSIDLASIMAGSGIRGQFEEKFKALLKDIEDEAGNVICFIDEVHTLFNLGKAEGSIDAGQMIKPALARGLQLVGATTRAFRMFVGVYTVFTDAFFQRMSTGRLLARTLRSSVGSSPSQSMSPASSPRSVSFEA